MKYLLIILSVVLFSSCDLDIYEKKSHKDHLKSISKKINYIVDCDVKGKPICYAVYSYTAVFGLAVVPCNKVMHRIVNPTCKGNKP